MRNSSSHIDRLTSPHSIDSDTSTHVVLLLPPRGIASKNRRIRRHPTRSLLFVVAVSLVPIFLLLSSAYHTPRAEAASSILKLPSVLKRPLTRFNSIMGQTVSTSQWFIYGRRNFTQ